MSVLSIPSENIIIGRLPVARGELYNGQDVMVFIGYLILRVQSAGLFNPNNIENMEPTLA